MYILTLKTPDLQSDARRCRPPPPSQQAQRRGGILEDEMMFYRNAYYVTGILTGYVQSYVGFWTTEFLLTSFVSASVMAVIAHFEAKVTT